MNQELGKSYNEERDIWALQLDEDLKGGEAAKGTLVPEDEEKEQVPCWDMGDIESLGNVRGIDSDLIWDCELPNIPLKMNSYIS